MLAKLKKVLETKTTHEHFFDVVGRYYPKGSKDYLLIEKAYLTAKLVFRDDHRDSGERYFEHLRSVALIVMVHMRVRDPDVIVAALLHDIIEDKEDWSEDRIALEFNLRCAQYVWWVSKPAVSKFHGDKKARNRAYHQNLTRSKRKPLLIKLADRLHNLITMWDYPIEKQKMKVEETENFYLQIAEEQIILIHELEAAIN
jgi:GTP pyrophosphokinase